MNLSSRKGQAAVIGTLVLIAASALMATLALFWGLSLQGQSLSNFGQAIYRGNSQASEQLSIDGVLFTKICVGGVPPCALLGNLPQFSPTVYVRNFGDLPLTVAAFHIQLLQSGISPQSYDCELSAHKVIVARFMVPFNLNTASICTGSPGNVVFANTWNAQTVSIQVATTGGTTFSNNYAVPSQ
ncbi:MAG: hypothetical protein LYZ66_07040 [Nitrososphaerales archaeon]|nr:hypothetical protein [Nitrososphaerales archaeon]